jgi:tetratricopeptide (TPR) repeat protein
VVHEEGSSPLAEQFAQARALCVSGRFDQAQPLCRQMLEAAPGHPQVLLLQAEIDSQLGRHQEAIAALTPLAERWPAAAAVHFCLGNALHAAGHLPEAAVRLRRAVQLEPHFAVAHSNLGLVLEEMGERDSAISSYERAVLLDASLAQARSNLGNALLKTEKDEKLHEAILHLRHALALRPQCASAHHQLGVALQRAGVLDGAIACHRAAIALQPNYPEAYYFLGAALDGTEQPEQAIDCYREGIAQRPQFAVAWAGLANAMRELGRFAEAIECYERAIQIDPELGLAHRGLATCRRVVPDSPQLDRLYRTLANEHLRDDDRGSCYLAVSKLHDDAGRYEEAFAAAERGNRLLRAAQQARNIRYDHDLLRAASDETARTFTSAYFAERATWGNDSELPVFIVGYFRSGTTLVEQICASHSGVCGGGELQDIPRLAGRLQRPPSAAREWTRELVRSHADRHLQRLEKLAHGAVRVTDKMPDNLFNLGLIATLFPRARVVFCHRDGRDAALSVFFQKFIQRVAFSTDLLDAGRRWHETERMAALWEKTLPLRIHHVQYETLIENFESEARRLIAFLGLEWEPACLEFHKTARTVKTASLWQVRQPLYSSSVGRWQNYRRHIAPLCDAIDIDIDAPNGARPKNLI